MDDCAFSFMGVPLVACASGALWWPAARLLCIADLHLGRAERVARSGGSLLPPYETADTIERLAKAIAIRKPQRVVALGDSFDDAAAATALHTDDRSRLESLVAANEWLWIAGNHDPGPTDLPGTHHAELALGPLVFRHAPDATSKAGEVVGHLHPKISRSFGGRWISRPCFVHDDRRLVLPAFGTYTGGLAADSPAMERLLDLNTAKAILTGRPCCAVPISKGRTRETRPWRWA